MKKTSFFFIFIIGIISGYYVLNIFVDNTQDKIAIVSLLSTIIFSVRGNYKEKLNEQNNTLKDIREYVLDEINDLKTYLSTEIKDIKYVSDKVDTQHSNALEILTQKIESLSITFNHHINSSGHTYTTEELFKLKKALDQITAILNVQTKYAEVHSRLIKLEQQIKVNNVS